ncbi:MAG TPA: MFS transporter [Candidatus Margulisiibacteriota bacterium]|nr:MFS transporter [Candidatus Margulisiibacteriota bacterium]
MTRTERSYYLLFGFYCVGWSVTTPMYALFLLSRGLDLLEINLVLATYLITAFVFEVPTGAVADLAGRRLSFVLSCGLRAAAFALYAFAHSFGDCVIAEFIDAVGTTLASGALDAWAIDGMRAEGNTRPADRFFARAQILARTLMIGGALMGGYVAQRRMEFTWFTGTAVFSATAIAALMLMREPPDVAPRRRPHWTGVHRSVGRTTREALTTVRDHPILLLLCIVTLTASFGIMPIHMLWQPRLKALTGEGTWFMAWVWAFLSIASIIGSALMPRLLGRYGRAAVLTAASLWRAVMLVIAGVAITVYPVIAGLLLQEMAFGLSEPLLQAWMNEHVEAERRATVLSVRAMSFTLGGGTGLVCIGWIARDIGMSAAWVTSGIVVGLTAAGFVVLARAGRRPTSEAAAVELVPPAVS